MYKKNRFITSLLLAIFASQAHAWFSIPTLESIKEAINEHKLATYSLAGTAACACFTTALLKTDYNAVEFGDDRYYWNWDKIDTSDVTFENSFIFGAGTSAYQVEGNCINTDWHRWERETDENGAWQHVQHQCNVACDQYSKYKDDVQLIKSMGLQIYRFSLAWDKIQPDEHTFNQEAINHYKDLCRQLAQHGIKAHIGFHHYTDPKWFADLGAFEKEDNIHYFVTFCERMLQEFKQDGIEVELWSTFNSPSGYAFHKYHVGDFPPGIKNDKQLTLTVLKNMMEAHVQVYQAKQKVNSSAKLGILKNIIQLDPWRPWHPLDAFATEIGTKMTDACIFSFFTTGKFVAKIPFDHAPFMAYIEHTNLDAPNSLDFIGLNYYSHAFIKNMTKFSHPREIKTQNPNYSLYPEGLHRAICTIDQEMAQPIETKIGKHVPIYVTENGLACNNEHYRELFFQRYMYALSKAKQDGHDVRGYIFWSFMDNYEWGSYKKKYGLVHVDFASKDLTRNVKQDKGTQYYLNLVNRAL